MSFSFVWFFWKNWIELNCIKWASYRMIVYDLIWLAISSLVTNYSINNLLNNCQEPFLIHFPFHLFLSNFFHQACVHIFNAFYQLILPLFPLFNVPFINFSQLFNLFDKLFIYFVLELIAWFFHLLELLFEKNEFFWELLNLLNKGLLWNNYRLIRFSESEIQVIFFMSSKLIRFLVEAFATFIGNFCLYFRELVSYSFIL